MRKNIFLLSLLCSLSISPALPMHEAAEKGELNEVKKLVKKGVEVNKKDRRKKTPLFYAAQGGKLEVAEYLVEKGATVNEGDSQTSPFHDLLFYAAKRGKLVVVKSLVENGAKINGKDRSGKTPLDLAERGGDTRVVAYLNSVISR